MANGHGGARDGAGRPPGTPNKATVEQKATLSDLAREHTDLALSTLVEVAQTGSDSARVAAANALLDRAYGKPVQANLVGQDPENPWSPVTTIEHIVVTPPPTPGR